MNDEESGVHMNQSPNRAEAREPDPYLAPSDHGRSSPLTEAHAGVALGTMCWMLAISLVAVIVIFGVTWSVTHSSS